MSVPKKDITWTIKVDKHFDDVISDLVKSLGYTGKAELTREAIREFLARRKLFSLLGGEPVIPRQIENNPEEALKKLASIFSSIPLETIKDEIAKGREDVEKAML